MYTTIHKFRGSSKKIISLHPQQQYIQLIKGDSKDFSIVEKEIYKKMLFFWTFCSSNNHQSKKYQSFPKKY